jgi:hypothetical protein
MQVKKFAEIISDLNITPAKNRTPKYVFPK